MAARRDVRPFLGDGGRVGPSDRYDFGVTSSLGSVLAVISYPPIPIFEVGPLRLSLHGLFAALGFLAGAWIATKRLGERGYDTAKYQSVLTWALIGSLLGARYLTAPAAILDGVPLSTALAPLGGNFSIMGGFAGGILVGWYRMRKVELPALPTFDASTFGLAVGTIVGRIGDLAIVEHLGTATDLPWGYGIKPGYDVAPQHNALECSHRPEGTGSAGSTTTSPSTTCWVRSSFSPRSSSSCVGFGSTTGSSSPAGSSGTASSGSFSTSSASDRETPRSARSRGIR